MIKTTVWSMPPVTCDRGHHTAESPSSRPLGSPSSSPPIDPQSTPNQPPINPQSTLSQPPVNPTPHPRPAVAPPAARQRARRISEAPSRACGDPIGAALGRCVSSHSHPSIPICDTLPFIPICHTPHSPYTSPRSISIYCISLTHTHPSPYVTPPHSSHISPKLFFSRQTRALPPQRPSSRRPSPR